MNVPFSKDEINRRMSTVSVLMRKQNLDMLICTSIENIYYLTNFQTPVHALHVLLIGVDKPPCIFSRQLEINHARFRTQLYSEGYDDHDPTLCFKKVKQYAKDCCASRVGYEGMFFPAKLFQELSTEIGSAIDLVDTSLVEELRVVKSQCELEYMRRASDVLSFGTQCAINHIRHGVSETFVAGEVWKCMMAMGCEYTANPCFIAGGESGLLGHHAAEDTMISKDQIVFFEIGACIQRYHSAVMHTVWVGDLPVPEWFKCTEQTIRHALEAGKKTAVPGALCCDVDLAIRSVLLQIPFECTIANRLGYSIGIGFSNDWSEKNVFTIHPTSQYILRENMTLHLIPWIQVPNIGSIGFSETVVVRSNSSLSLRNTPR